MKTRNLATLMLPFALQACASFNGAPPRFAASLPAIDFNDDDPLATLYPVGWNDLTTDDQRQAKRNDFITARMLMIDLAYLQYERSLLAEARETGFGTALALLAMTTTATAVSDKGAKTALAAVTAGTVGTKQAFDKEVLLDRTIQVLQSQMKASRAKTKAQILDRLGQPYRQYTIALALSDVETYYQAGTMSGSLLSATETVADAVKSGEAAVDAQLTSRFDASPSALQLFDYFGADSLSDQEAARRKSLGMRALKSIGVPPSVTPLLFADQTRDPALKSRFVQELIKIESDFAGQSLLQEILRQQLKRN